LAQTFEDRQPCMIDSLQGTIKKPHSRTAMNLQQWDDGHESIDVTRCVQVRDKVSDPHH